VWAAVVFERVARGCVSCERRLDNRPVGIVSPCWVVGIVSQCRVRERPKIPFAVQWGVIRPHFVGSL
jgi:hypothetical protein